MTEKKIELLRTIGYDDTLSHHGVKGMRWGVRKSITKSSKGSFRKKALSKIDKYRVQKAKERLEKKKQRAKDAAERKEIKKTHDLTRGKIKRLTDQELRTRLNRLQQEKQLRELVESEVAPGRTAVKRILKSAAIGLGTAAATGGLFYLARVGSKGFVEKDGKTTYSAKAAKEAFHVVDLMNEMFKKK